MDLFDAYPELAGRDVSLLRERSLRLIAVAGLVYDDYSFYFELGQPRYWGRLTSGEVSVGVGTAKVQPDGTFPLHHALIRFVRREWRLQVELFPPTHSYLLDESGGIRVLPDVEAHIPYFLVFTAPRLGGGEVPDALVQGVHLLPISGVGPKPASAGVLRVARSALMDFLAPESWRVEDLLAQSWAESNSRDAFPTGAQMRPVLALRGLRSLIMAGALPGALAGQTAAT